MQAFRLTEPKIHSQFSSRDCVAAAGGLQQTSVERQTNDARQVYSVQFNAHIIHPKTLSLVQKSRQIVISPVLAEL